MAHKSDVVPFEISVIKNGLDGKWTLDPVQLKVEMDRAPSNWSAILMGGDIILIYCYKDDPDIKIKRIDLGSSQISTFDN